MMKLPSEDSFIARAKALEDSFFMLREQQLLEKLRQEMEHFEESRKLAHVSGIVEEHVLQDLATAGIRAETLIVVTLIPLIEVAWCDGSVSPAEKDAILNAAAAEGIKPETAAHHLLSQWLKERPDSRVVAAWKEYVGELARIMPAESIATMRKRIIDRATRVAEAAGGFLGLATISKIEQATLAEFAKAAGG